MIKKSKKLQRGGHKGGSFKIFNASQPPHQKHVQPYGETAHPKHAAVKQQNNSQPTLLRNIGSPSMIKLSAIELGDKQPRRKLVNTRNTRNTSKASKSINTPSQPISPNVKLSVSIAPASEASALATTIRRARAANESKMSTEDKNKKGEYLDLGEDKNYQPVDYMTFEQIRGPNTEEFADPPKSAAQKAVSEEEAKAKEEAEAKAKANRKANRKRSKRSEGSVSHAPAHQIDINKFSKTEFAQLPNLEAHEKLQNILYQTQKVLSLDNLPEEERQNLENESIRTGKPMEFLLNERRVNLFLKRKDYIDELAKGNSQIKNAITDGYSYTTEKINKLIQTLLLSKNANLNQAPPLLPRKPALAPPSLLQRQLAPAPAPAQPKPAPKLPPPPEPPKPPEPAPPGMTGKQKKEYEKAVKKSYNEAVARYTFLTFANLSASLIKFRNDYYGKTYNSESNSRSYEAAKLWTKQGLTIDQVKEIVRINIEYLSGR